MSVIKPLKNGVPSPSTIPIRNGTSATFGITDCGTQHNGSPLVYMHMFAPSNVSA